MTEKSKKALLVGGGVVALLGVGWYVYSQSADTGSESGDFVGRRVASLSRFSPGGDSLSKGGREMFKSSSKYAPLAAQIGQQA